MRLLVASVLAAVVLVAAAERPSKELPSVYGMQGFRVFADTPYKRAYVMQLQSEPGYDFLRVPRDPQQPIEVLVAADLLRAFKEHLGRREVEYEIFVKDVGKVFESQKSMQLVARRLSIGPYDFKHFPRYSEIKQFLEKLQQTHSDVVSLFTMGRSFEGRELLGVKLSSGGLDKPILFIDAGIHAREWLAPTTALYAIKQFAENSTNRALLEHVDVYIVPSLNPDGYEFTHNGIATRMWRKTRSTNKGSSCRGVDANRNFGMMWNTVGASNNPCSEIYAGEKAFSEPESRALRDFILGLKGRVKAYLSLHSYGNYMLHPWGFTSKLPQNEPLLRCVAQKAVGQLTKVRGTRYIVGSSTNVLYAASGGSDDWAMGMAGAEISYTVELPGGTYGFAPPPSFIIPVGLETFEALKVFVQFVEGKVCR